MDVKRLLKSDRLEFIFNRHGRLIKMVRKKGNHILFYIRFHKKKGCRKNGSNVSSDGTKDS